jgi:hypothetical protein
VGVFRKKKKRTVQGYADVVDVQRRDADRDSLSCWMKLRLDVPGIPQQVVEHRAWFGSESRWPEVGMRVPVSVDLERPGDVEADWEAVWGRVRGGRFGVAAEMIAASAGIEVDLSTGPPKEDGQLEGKELQDKLQRLSVALQNGAITYDEYTVAVQRATGMSG